MLKTIAKLLIAGLGLAAVCWVALNFFYVTHPHASDWENLIVLLITICLGAAVFFGGAYLFRVAEVHDIVELVRRRIGTR
jgi:hypothetical protein